MNVITKICAWRHSQLISHARATPYIRKYTYYLLYESQGQTVSMIFLSIYNFMIQSIVQMAALLDDSLGRMHILGRSQLDVANQSGAK